MPSNSPSNTQTAISASDGHNDDTSSQPIGYQGIFTSIRRAADTNRTKKAEQQSVNSTDQATDLCEEDSRPNYSRLWPLALAPVYPLAGIALRKQPALRNKVFIGLSIGILTVTHLSAVSTSQTTK